MFLGGRAIIEEYILEILKNEMIESSNKLSNKCEKLNQNHNNKKQSTPKHKKV